jgi:hypothetical protein
LLYGLLAVEGFREMPNLLNGMKNLSIEDEYLRAEEAGEEGN